MSDRFQISEVEESDLEEIALMIQTSSTSSLSPRIVLEFRNVPRSTFLAYNLAGLRSEFNGCASSNGLAEMYKIVDSQIDKIVGFAVWGWDESTVDRLFSEKAKVPLPEGTNTVLRHRFINELSEMEKSIRPKGRYFELLELITAPTHRRLGLGRQLINIGLSRADAESVPCYLSGSPMGVPVYAKCGFREVGRISIGLDEYLEEEGDEEFKGVVHVHVGMVREPAKMGDV